MSEEIKFFNRWDSEGIEVKDLGLKNYINLKPRIVPKTGNRNVTVRFHKSKTSIVERLINKLFVPGHRGKKHKITSGHATGKTSNAYDAVYRAFEIIEERLNKNPIEILVRAVENAAPREEIVSIEYGGARYPKAVECSPQKRVDTALRNFVIGTYNKSFRSKKSIAESLAEELIAAYRCEDGSFAISKKLELEKQADSSR